MPFFTSEAIIIALHQLISMAFKQAYRLARRKAIGFLASIGHLQINNAAINSAVKEEFSKEFLSAKVFHGTTANGFHYAFAVAENDGKHRFGVFDAKNGLRVGIANLTPSEKGYKIDFGEVNHAEIHPAHRGRGIYSCVMALLMKTAHENNAGFAGRPVNNLAMRQVLQSFGWKIHEKPAPTKTRAILSAKLEDFNHEKIAHQLPDATGFPSARTISFK